MTSKSTTGALMIAFAAAAGIMNNVTDEPMQAATLKAPTADTNHQAVPQMPDKFTDTSRYPDTWIVQLSHHDVTPENYDKKITGFVVDNQRLDRWEYVVAVEGGGSQIVPIEYNGPINREDASFQTTSLGDGTNSITIKPSMPGVSVSFNVNDSGTISNLKSRSPPQTAAKPKTKPPACT